MASDSAIRHPISSTVPSADDAKLARASSRQLSRYQKKNLKVRIPDTNETVELPASAVRMLVDLLSAMGDGSAVSLMPVQAELTTQQAADQLGVSRPFLIHLLEEGKIPFRKVGSHRRIAIADLMAFKNTSQAERLKALEELTRQAQDLKMGY